jgi:hypothetical protein
MSKFVQCAVLIAASLLVTGPAHSATSVDWKLYGGAKIGATSDYCFYDAEGVVKQPDTHLRVWTKCLSENEMDSVDIEKEPDNKITKNAARKIIGGYVPPIIAIEKMDFNKIADVAAAEEIANASGIQPHSRILYELNCSEKMLRELSITIYGKIGPSDRPKDWKYVGPETNAATLLTILCPRR